MQQAHKIVEPSVCPFCGTSLVRLIDDGAHLYCLNAECPERLIKKLKYFVSKDCINIDGISEKTLQKLCDNAGVKYWWDLYALSKNDISAAGIGPKTTEKICSELDKSMKETDPENILLALGIPMVGKVTSSLLLKHFRSIANIAKASLSDLNSVDGIGEVCAKCVYDYMQANEVEIRHAISLFQTEMRADDSKGISDKLAGYTILATGTLKNFTREGIKKSVVDNGGKYASGVSKKLSFLIVGDAAGKNKTDKAKELGIKMVTEDEYLAML